jgi:hypothetical protein
LRVEECISSSVVLGGRNDLVLRTSILHWFFSSGLLSKMFNDKGILVEISAQSIGSKIIRIEAMNKEASD